MGSRFGAAYRCIQSVSNSAAKAALENLRETTLVFKRVPAQVCPICGEAYVDEAASRQILPAAEEAARSGVQVDVREFVPASAS